MNPHDELIRQVPGLLRVITRRAGLTLVSLAVLSILSLGLRWYVTTYKSTPPPRPQSTTAAPVLTPAELRDQERYRAINSLRIALDSYRNLHRRYPATLAELSPAFLSSLPTDPVKDTPYAYIANEAGFRIDFDLEQGLFALAPGPHTVTNRGFDLPIKGLEVPIPAEPKTPPADQSFASDKDTDGDSLTDDDEVEIYGTDPMKADTDGDGYNDGEEIRSGYNPLGEGKR